CSTSTCDFSLNATTPIMPPYVVLNYQAECSRSGVTAVGGRGSPFGACACSAVRSAAREEKRNENPNARFFGSGTRAWHAARGFCVVRCSRRPGRQGHGKGRLQEGGRDRPGDQGLHGGAARRGPQTGEGGPG